MYAISSAASRVLIATSTAPAAGTPVCASSSSVVFSARNATRSSFSIPASWSATASRRERSRNSAQVSRRSPSTTAIASGNTAAERSRNASGVSGERCTAESMLYPRTTVAQTASDTTFRNLLVRRDGPAATITLNRPEKRNALSLELMEELIAALEQVGGDRDVRAIVIEGAGPAFSAGHDLGEMVDRDAAFYERLFDVCTVTMETVHRVPQPVIAKVHAMATAAGCQLVASCDLVVAAEEARFATPGVKIGLFCSTPMVPISRAVGRKRALQLLLTGDPIDAQTAADWGLVNLVVPADELDAAVGELVEKIARSSPLTVGIGKEAFYRQVDLDEHGAYELTRRVMVVERRGARCPGGHECLPGQARARVAGRVALPTAGRGRRTPARRSCSPAAARRARARRRSREQRSAVCCRERCRRTSECRRLS